uniref:NADH-ubiquinone oxidoreductase chain 3 n=1 Tax=Neotrogla sp. 5 KY-2017 TaxID=2051645 RepID=A0A343QCB5_9NEOP|nr:NADH dehydrogenase subunit 3 [Neotrogla sp. 5 KY-2017]
MISMIISSMLMLMISLFMNQLATLISKKTIEDYEKSSPFECGFDPIKSSRLPFSIRFFLITIIFLIFDVEISVILPLIKDFQLSENNEWLISSSIFILLLIIGLIHEWNQGSLEWAK